MLNQRLQESTHILIFLVVKNSSSTQSKQVRKYSKIGCVHQLLCASLHAPQSSLLPSFPRCVPTLYCILYFIVYRYLHSASHGVSQTEALSVSVQFSSRKR